jgi:hypothetical protein
VRKNRDYAFNLSGIAATINRAHLYSKRLCSGLDGAEQSQPHGIFWTRVVSFAAPKAQTKTS